MNETELFLPSLEKIRIVNYSLFSEDIEYDFIEGVNLIIGGNGVGKTTFINIIKYALIGLYKKDLTVRNYGGKKKYSRSSYSNNNSYFRSRTKQKESDKSGYVEIFFKINNVKFKVKRSLYNVNILETSYIENGSNIFLKGEIIKQEKYDKIEDISNSFKKRTLQYQYEKTIIEKTHLSDFEDFIFFINKILLFGETRENVLWSIDTQKRLLSNFINDPKLEIERKNYMLDAKYQDSISRHKQEEIKALDRVLHTIERNNNPEENNAKIKDNLVEELEKREKREKDISFKRKDLQLKNINNYKTLSEISEKINSADSEKDRIEFENNKKIWFKTNPKYQQLKKQLTNNCICPMCNTPIEDKNLIFDEQDKCFFCHSDLNKNSISNEALNCITKDISQLRENRKTIESEIFEIESSLKELDVLFSKNKRIIFELRNKLRSYEEESSINTESSYVAMINRKSELIEQKKEASKKSELNKQKADEIIQKIQMSLIENTNDISSIFKDFAEAFLQLNCFLTLEDNNNATNIYVPVIDGIARYDSEELSESQRFFIDYSFRMSILSYFYNAPSFYICETPDSSLDISYEENAVNTFLKFLNKPNVLIISSNLNNSNFLTSLISKAKEVSHVKILNLLNYGKTSEIQQNNQLLNELSKEIERLINE